MSYNSNSNNQRQRHKMFVSLTIEFDAVPYSTANKNHMDKYSHPFPFGVERYYTSIRDKVITKAVQPDYNDESGNVRVVDVVVSHSDISENLSSYRDEPDELDDPPPPE